tara:strand:- start:5410 stop:5745 length:336 start_codon:yes stop_codon:yes gene_type:complete
MWKCMECESQTRFKGLCRECTIYDKDSGDIITPIQRVRLNTDGTLWVAPAKSQIMETKDMLKSMRVMRTKKPSKKQMALMADEIKEFQDAEKELADSDMDMIEIGEGVEEE